MIYCVNVKVKLDRIISKSLLCKPDHFACILITPMITITTRPLRKKIKGVNESNNGNSE